jgi:hypothetical protein
MGGALACKVNVVPHRIFVPEKVALPQSDRDGSVHCLVIADSRSSLARKNVTAAIELFRTAFGGRPNARLVLKLRNMKEFMSSASDIRAYAAEDRRCQLIDETLDPLELWGLIRQSDILISCHRSILPIAAMSPAAAARLTPVIVNSRWIASSSVASWAMSRSSMARSSANRSNSRSLSQRRGGGQVDLFGTECYLH